ncbi:tagatose 6-phosphate kinase [Luteibacter rhizovicinus]|uniref:Phosphofructokinase n=1 Tax=Luteibacter rhizovicinus TaxID=242606 RepID=A0A4R3YWH9_9GAMM|nr:hexose kinase [Luteibacter rhizovicinus]TCV97467.1 tagatose 6-phosphate kinase [Luteibacter rhizovicinus]
MIAVAGFNTAIDRLITLDRLVVGEVNRASEVRTFLGGKGVHVAQTVAALGERVQLVGLIDAATRNEATRLMSERGVLFHAVEIEGDLRSCLSIRDANGHITEILDGGNEVPKAQRSALIQALLTALTDSDTVVLSGSLPRGFDAHTYAELALHIGSAGKRCLVDTSGQALAHAVAVRPFLVKPNRDEASALSGVALSTVADGVRAAATLLRSGVTMPVVSLGELGVIGIDASGAWHARAALGGRAVNAVGSGDCLMAGLAVGLVRGMALCDVLQLGAACGAANAMNDETGYASADDIAYWHARVRVERVASGNSSPPD